jgi:hypothetical protein
MTQRKSTELIQRGGVFTLVGGFRVRVEILDKEEAREEMGNEVLAQYFHEDHLIQLRKSRSMKQRRADFEHELQHMCVDWVDFFIRRARK